MSKLAETPQPQKISKEEINNLIYTAQQLEQQAQQYQKQIDILNSYHTEIQSAEQTLVELSDCEDKHNLLVPIGAGCFIYASIQAAEKVIVSIGARVHTEKNLPEAIKGVQKKKSEIDSQLSQIRSSYNEVVERLSGIDMLLKSV